MVRHLLFFSPKYVVIKIKCILTRRRKIFDLKVKILFAIQKQKYR